MSYRRMFSIGAIFTLCISMSLHAQNEDCHRRLGEDCRQQTTEVDPGCPKCRLTKQEVAVEKHCWQVEDQKICFPRFVFPWRTGCERCPPPTSMRSVQALKKLEYTAPEHRYRYRVVTEYCRDPLNASEAERRGVEHQWFLRVKDGPASDSTPNTIRPDLHPFGPTAAQQRRLANRGDDQPSRPQVRTAERLPPLPTSKGTLSF